jgi:hypothetical protein
MDIRSDDNNKGFITQTELKNFIFIGGIVLTGVIYVLNMQTELSLLKNEIQHMKEMIKELHDHQIGARTRISALRTKSDESDNFDLIGNLHDIEVEIVDGVINVMKITNAANSRRNENNNNENNEELPTEMDEVVLYDNRKRYFDNESSVDEDVV